MRRIDGWNGKESETITTTSWNPTRKFQQRVWFLFGSFSNKRRLCWGYSCDNWAMYFRLFSVRFSTTMRDFNSIWILVIKKSWTKRRFLIFFHFTCCIQVTEFTGNGNQRDGVNQWELTVPLEFLYLMLIRYHDIMFYFLSFTMFYFSFHYING